MCARRSDSAPASSEQAMGGSVGMAAVLDERVVRLLSTFNPR
jgi:hypothetical protein